MSVGAASGLLVSGAIGDDHDRRRTFLTGTIILAIDSVLGTLTPSALLIIARIAEGLGDATILACSLGLIGQAYTKHELALAIAGRLMLSESLAKHPRRIDVVGTLMLGLGMAIFLAGLTVSRTGWDLSVYGLLIGGLALLAGFVAVEHRIASPMLDLSLFRRADFVGATLAADVRQGPDRNRTGRRTGSWFPPHASKKGRADF
jgi:MFS family permease